MKPVLILIGGRAGDICNLKYAFVAIDAEMQLSLLSREAVFLAPWEGASLVRVPEDTVCRGDEGDFYLHKDSSYTKIDCQKDVRGRLKELVFKECVLF